MRFHLTIFSWIFSEERKYKKNNPELTVIAEKFKIRAKRMFIIKNENVDLTYVS